MSDSRILDPPQIPGHVPAILGPPPASLTGRLARALWLVWSRRWIGIGIAVAVAGTFGAILGITMPRGPLTTPQSLIALMSSLLVGGTAGFVMRSRWAMLLAPAVFMVVYELGRAGTDGPTVDAINLSNVYGVIAFVVGRGFTGLLTVLPMLVGAVYGAALARRLGRSIDPTRVGQSTHRFWRGTRRVAAAVTALVVIALAVLIARPAGTDPILTADGSPDSAAVAELTQVRIGGHDQTIMIRGASVDAPVLLFVAGGPGGTDIGAMRLVRCRPRTGLRGRHLGSAGCREVLSRIGSHCDADVGPVGPGHRRGHRVPAATGSTNGRSIWSASPGAPSPGCSPPRNDPTCSTPTSASGRWST